MNNNTTARISLRASENVSTIEQQILGQIKREGAGQFYNIEQQPTPPAATPAPKKAHS